MYQIKYGLGGGFGGANMDWEDCPFIETENEAMDEAYRCAMEEYESYAGHHGLRSVEQIMEEDGYDEDEAQQEFNEEAESWLDYLVRLKPEGEK